MSFNNWTHLTEHTPESKGELPFCRLFLGQGDKFTTTRAMDLMEVREHDSILQSWIKRAEEGERRIAELEARKCSYCIDLEEAEHD